MHFVVVGAGGLGCPALLGLSAAVRRGDACAITVIDPDVVEASNLQRQVLYSTADVGMSKASAAVYALRRRRADLTLTAVRTRLEPAALPAFVAGLPPASVVLECTDQPALKFGFNDACLAAGTPLVIGAALGWRAQIIAVEAGRACYRCIYEDPPADAASCDAAGVLGPAVGVAGYVMAAAALRLAANSAETSGRLLAFDSATAGIQTLAPAPRAGCPACAAAAS